MPDMKGAKVLLDQIGEGTMVRSAALASIVEPASDWSQWRAHLGGEAPAHLPRWLLMRVLAYRDGLRTACRRLQ